MKKLLGLISLFVITHAWAAYPSPSSDAQALIARVDPVNCNEFSAGFYCYLRINSKLVSVVVPRNYRASGDCLVHFHGLRFRDPEDTTARATIEYFKFAEALNTQAPGSLMIAPVGAFGRSNYTLAQDYGSLSKLKSLLDGVKARSAVSCTKLTLSGHSAAYQVITPVLKQANASPDHTIAKMLTRVFMFDAFYSSNVADFSTWVADSSAHALYNVSQSGSSTRTNSLKVRSSTRYKNYLSSIANHWKLVRDKYFADFLALK